MFKMMITVVTFVLMFSAASAQTIERGKSRLGFTQDEPSDTTGYALCVDSATPAVVNGQLTGCIPLNVERQGSTVEFRFTAPTSLPLGDHNLAIFALRPAGGQVPGVPGRFSVTVIPPSQPSKLFLITRSGGSGDGGGSLPFRTDVSGHMDLWSEPTQDGVDRGGESFIRRPV